jgi:N-acetylglucosamine-6-phosphate deacetylase
MDGGSTAFTGNMKHPVSVTVLVNMKLLYQDEIHENLCVILQDGIIADIFPDTQLPAFLETCGTERNTIGVTTVDCNQHFLSPGFIDLQVYGSGGLLFGTYPDACTLERMETDLLTQGTTGFLATMATNTLEIFEKGFGAAHTHTESDRFKGSFWGLHLEGPYISVAKRGAHPAEYIRTPTEEEVETLLVQAKGSLKMMTIAPELVALEVRKVLKSHNVVLSSGHSNATLTEGMEFLADGTVSAVTHLYNAMPPMFHRPGSVGYIPAVFSHQPFTSIIADGIHVDYAMFDLAKRELKDKLFLITDAVTETSEGIYQHHLHIEKRKQLNDKTGDIDEVEISRKYVMPDGTLSGSALTMLMAVRNCVQNCNISLCEAVRMASLYPAQLLGVQDRVGSIERGLSADLCLFNSNFDIVSTYKNGVCAYVNMNIIAPPN